MFNKNKIDLELIKSEKLENSSVLLHYNVLKGEKNDR